MRATDPLKYIYREKRAERGRLHTHLYHSTCRSKTAQHTNPHLSALSHSSNTNSTHLQARVQQVAGMMTNYICTLFSFLAWHTHTLTNFPGRSVMKF